MPPKLAAGELPKAGRSAMKRSLVPGMRSVFGSTMKEKAESEKEFNDAMNHDVETLFAYVEALESVVAHARVFASPATSLSEAIRVVDEFHEKAARGEL